MRYPRILSISVIFLLAGCSYLIPENPSAPRYTAVLGDRHRPSLNERSMAGASQGEDTVMSQEAAPVPTQEISAIDTTPPMMAPQNPAFPPVDAATQAQAQAMMGEPYGGRQVPVENAGATMAANDFNNVPPRPIMNGTGSAEQQLDQVRSQLEQDRANADAARGQLSRDAAAEPSMLPGPGAATSGVPAMPPAVIPSSVPRMNPVSPMAPASVPAPGPSSYIAPSPLMPPPPQSGYNVTYPPAAVGLPMASSAVPMASGLEPIILRPPAGDAPQAVAAAPMPRSAAPDAVAMAPSASSFNPMASGGAAYAGGSYLPGSRYTR